MGWYYGWSSKKELIQELVKTYTTSIGESSLTLRHCYRGNTYRGVLWSVKFITHANKSSEIIICCDLLHRKYNDGWGFKPMDETMGPCYYSCPMSYLNMVPIPDSIYAINWRSKVIEYHKNLKERITRERKMCGQIKNT